MVHWNINGWTTSNCKLRALLLRSLNPDIISLNETHLSGDSVIEIAGYSWFGNNRNRHLRAPKGTGGVGVLVKNERFEHFKIEVVDKSMEGIIGVRFEH